MDTPTPSLTSREALIGDALSQILRLLRDVQATPRIRELRSQARQYERAVRHWAVVAPTNVQLDAMLDLVTELHADTLGTERKAPA